MKRLRIIITAVLFFCTIIGKFSSVSAAEDIETSIKDSELYSKSAVLIDGDSGRVLYGKNELEQLPMASTTKIMTCIIALEYGDLEDEVTVTSYAAAMPKVKLGMKADEQYKLEDLLYSLMLESHNDSAVAIAEHIGGSVEGFARMMNEKAREIGCYNTYFITPNGLDDEITVDGETKVHSTTATDLARILKYCIKDSAKKDDFLTITRASNYSFTNLSGKRNFSCNNHNSFLNMMDGALSGKTGFTGDAGYCYVGALERDGKTFIVALLACGWPNNKSYKWSDTKTLMNFGLKNYSYQDVFEKGTIFKPILVKSGISNETGGMNEIINGNVSTMVVLEDYNLKLLIKDSDNIRIDYEVPDILYAPVKKGEIVGNVKYILNGEIIMEYPIIAASDVERINFKWCIKKVFGFFSV